MSSDLILHSIFCHVQRVNLAYAFYAITLLMVCYAHMLYAGDFK